MREILFKAKDKDDGKWYEGYYWCTSDTTYCVAEDYERYPDNTHHYLLFDRMVDWGLPNRKLKADIDPDTLCQFTGLYDKNRKKIWEGDIVRDIFNDSVVGYVRYGEYRNAFNDDEFGGHVGFYIEWKDKKDLLRKDLVFWVKNSEFIGNIFDNPELLNAPAKDLDQEGPYVTADNN